MNYAQRWQRAASLGAAYFRAFQKRKRLVARGASPKRLKRARRAALRSLWSMFRDGYVWRGEMA